MKKIVLLICAVLMCGICFADKIPEWVNNVSKEERNIACQNLQIDEKLYVTFFIQNRQSKDDLYDLRKANIIEGYIELIQTMSRAILSKGKKSFNDTNRLDTKFSNSSSFYTLDFNVDRIAMDENNWAVRYYFIDKKTGKMLEYKEARGENQIFYNDNFDEIIALLSSEPCFVGFKQNDGYFIYKKMIKNKNAKSVKDRFRIQLVGSGREPVKKIKYDNCEYYGAYTIAKDIFDMAVDKY